MALTAKTSRCQLNTILHCQRDVCAVGSCAGAVHSNCLQWQWLELVKVDAEALSLLSLYRYWMRYSCPTELRILLALQTYQFAWPIARVCRPRLNPPKYILSFYLSASWLLHTVHTSWALELSAYEQSCRQAEQKTVSLVLLYQCQLSLFHPLSNLPSRAASGGCSGLIVTPILQDGGGSGAFGLGRRPNRSRV